MDGIQGAHANVGVQGGSSNAPVPGPGPAPPPLPQAPTIDDLRTSLEYAHQSIDSLRRDLS